MFVLILRRLFWMVPTLLAISVLSFIIIQLPPGDYLTSYISALQETGETVSIEQVAALRKRYNLDDPTDVIGEEFDKILRKLGLKRSGIGFYTLRNSLGYFFVRGLQTAAAASYTPSWRWPFFLRTGSAMSPCSTISRAIAL